MQMFTAALFISRNNPNVHLLQVDKQNVVTHTIEYYPPLKITKVWAAGVAQMVASKHEALSSNPNTNLKKKKKPG
jgi:hypothetical protein